MNMKASPTIDATKLPASLVPPLPTDHHRDRAYRRQAAVVELTRRSVAPLNLHLLIQDAAALVAESLSVERFGVAELDDEGAALEMRLGTVAATGQSALGEMSAGTMSAHQLSLNPKRSLAAYAFQAGEVVSVTDLPNEKRFTDDWLSKQGVRSAVVVPLHFHDQSYGVLGAFSSRPQQFARDDLLYAEMIAHLVSTNIARDKTASTLESERRFTTTVLQTVEALVLVLTPAGRIAQVNSACEQITGYACEELRDRTISSALLVPGDADALKEVFSQLQTAGGQLDHESYLLTKQAERRRIAWTFAVLSRSGEKIETILATGIDISDRRAAEEEVGRLRAAEEEADRRLKAVLAELESQKTGAAQGDAAAGERGSAEGEDGGWGMENSPFHALPHGVGRDRRQRPRRSFAYYQRIAPTNDGQIPPLRTFRRVKCLDISAGGFSFLSSVTPADTNYVVALGNPPVVIHVAARVAHVTSMQYEGQAMYLVGCSYTGRLDY